MRHECLGFKILSLTFFIIFSVTIYAQPERSLTWQDDYFPQFKITIYPGDLEKLLVEGETAKFPMTLNYQGKSYPATIRQRGFGGSDCGDKRQFRIDFKSKVTLPDGYVTDRFETDHGSCYTLHEWLAWRFLDKAAELHPELKVLRKKSNVTAVYFNGELYHVQTLLEDVSKDLLEPQLGTRNLKTFKSGCYGRNDEKTEIDEFCASFSPSYLQSVMDIKSFLYTTAAIQVLGSQDNYPSFPYNYYFIQTLTDGKIWFMPDDLDQTISSDAGPYWNPYLVAYPNDEFQGQYLALLKNPESRQIYINYVRELSALLNPEDLNPRVEAKYSQIRETLMASPNLPISVEFYDYSYQVSVPTLLEERYKYLASLSPEEGKNQEPSARIVELPTIIEATDSEGILIKLDGSPSTDPDGDSLSYTWYLDNQKFAQTVIAEAELSLGSHTIVLKVEDGKGGVNTTQPLTIQVFQNPLAITSVDNSRLQKRSSQNLTIRGVGFQAGARVSLGSDVYVDAPFAFSNSSLSVRVYVTGNASVGARDLIVINPDGKEAKLQNKIFIE